MNPFSHQGKRLTKGVIPAHNLFLLIQETQSHEIRRLPVQETVKHASVIKKLLIISMKPGGGPSVLFPYGDRSLINLQPFPDAFARNRLSSPLLYLAPPPNKREKAIFASLSFSVFAAKL